MNWRYFFVGGIGAVLPAAVSLYFVDPKTTFIGFNLGVFLGYVLKNAIGYVLGGLSVGFKKEQVDNWTLIQLGMAAPAMFQLLIAGAQVPGQVGKMDFNLVSVAYAGQPAGLIQVKDFATELPGIGTNIAQGITGARPDTFYLLSQKDDLPAAKAFAEHLYDEMRKKDLLRRVEGKPGLTVQIYIPYKKSLSYSVVVGEKLKHEEADELAKVLLAHDFKGFEVWDLVCECFPDRKKE